mmetsp:Transcript_6516/g.14290  ORF Transcript_6516/g.14290 Transcript_6516/m.14290 type:complete len:197 (+) Transcript_6516:121-711(+)
MNKLLHVLIGIAVLLSCQDSAVYAQNGGNGGNGKKKRKKVQAKTNGGEGGWMGTAWKNGKTFSLLEEIDQKGCGAFEAKLAEARRNQSDLQNGDGGGGGGLRKKLQRKKLKKNLRFEELAFCLRCANAASGVNCDADQSPEVYCGNLESTKMRLKKRLKKAQAGQKRANPWRMTLLTNQKSKVETQMAAICDVASR